MQSRNGQQDQLAIFTSALTRRPCLDKYQCTQLYIEARSILRILNDAEKNIIIYAPSFVNPNNNSKGY